MVKRRIIAGSSAISIGDVLEQRNADIEDLFTADFYLELLRRSGVGGGELMELPPGDRITKRVERALGTPYDHYGPAAYLLEHQDELMPMLEEETLGRFERLFALVNDELHGSRPH